MEFRESMESGLRFIMKNRSRGGAGALEPLDLAASEFEMPEESRGLVAIDGSYTFLLNMSNIWLGVVRVVAMDYELLEGGFRLRDAEVFERPELVAVSKDVAEELGERHLAIYERSVKYSTEPQREMLNQLMNMAEEDMALRTASNEKGKIVVLDGSLTPFRGTDTLERAIDKACENDNLLVGISKDSYSTSISGNRTDEEVLASSDLGPGFVPAPGIKKGLKGSELYSGMLGDVYFAKLHEDSPKWFRVDVGAGKEHVAKVLGHLASYSSSSLCPGYPFPMMEAHRFAVTVRHFRDLYEEMVMDIGSKSGLELQDIINGLTHVEGRRLSAFHEYLDKYSREV